MNNFRWTLLLLTSLILIGSEVSAQKLVPQKVYQDIPYIQDYAVKYYFETDT